MDYKKLIATLALGAFCITGVAGCGAQKQTTETGAATGQPAQEQQVANEKGNASAEGQVAGKDEMVTPESVVDETMTPIYGDELVNGDYAITVNSSSSMFKIADCVLHVADGKMTADMTMGGTGYLYLFMGTGEEAAAAKADSYISFKETEEGHVFTVPVEALDMAVNCAAFSKNKEKWYDRQLAFLAKNLPVEAYKEAPMKTLEQLGLQDGNYTVEVVLSGGSGKAKVESPAKMTVKDGEAIVTLVWSSKNYDYVKAGKGIYQPITTDPTAVFEIPVLGFDYEMPIAADTTAMSTPHEIEYTLHFDSSTITAE